jgi:DNA-binding MltR family transcriptional regulator
MAEPSSITSLKSYYSVRARTIEPKKLVESLRGESDRTLVVVWGSLIEDVLTEEIRRKLRPMDEKEEKDLKLYSFDGPIGSFSVKINVGYALQVIDEHTRAELHDLRHMRNACAHSFKPIGFSTPELATVMRRLFMPERKSFIRMPPDDTDAETLRSLFVLKTSSLLVTITHGSEEAERFVREQAEAKAKAQAKAENNPPSETPNA